MNHILRQIAKMIDHSILHPAFTDDDLTRECEIAKKYLTATVCVKPFHVEKASQILKGTGVGICAVTGFPHGNSTVGIKVQETLQVILDGADEVDVVVNIGKVLQRDWDYIEKEISALQDTCEKHNVLLKVIFETDFLPDDNLKIMLCQVCSQAGVAFVKTSTGYGFHKNDAGSYFYEGATDHDLILMRKHCSTVVQIKAAGGIRTLDDVLRVRELGVTRVGATATRAIMEQAAAVLV